MRRVALTSLLAIGFLLMQQAAAHATLQLLKQNPSDAATFSGHGGYSSDGLGQNSTTGGTVQANVPAGSTVVQAYLYGSYSGDANPPQAERTIDFDGTNVELQFLANSEPGNSDLATARANVTSQVAAKVGSGGGITNFAINNDPGTLDGVALVVIFSNPALPENTIAVLDGGSKQSGDTVTYNFSSAINPSAPGFSATLALGSGFSFQGSSPNLDNSGDHLCGADVDQSSLIDVNGGRLTSCAGNYDDGFGANGALITVGGVGDSPNNPSDPNQRPADGATPRVEDDELYNLVPLMSAGDTQLVIDTSNPSSDDNLFLAIISTTAQAAVTTEICDNGLDDDGDTLVDGADPDCAPRGKISARGTVQTAQGPTIGFSAANNCTPSLSTRPSIVGTTAGARIWTKTTVTQSTCTDAPPVSPLGFDTQTGTATGTFGPSAPGGRNGQQGTLQWTYHDNSPDTVQFTLKDSSSTVVFQANQQTPSAFSGTPGGVWTFGP